MRQIRFAAIAFVGLVAAIASSFIDPGTFFHRTLSVALCSVLGLTSNLCYANLARNSGDRAAAALPPTEQTQNTAPSLDFSPYFQSTRPEFEGSDVPAKPETSNPPSNSSPPQPSPSAPSNAPSPSDRPPEPNRLVPGSSGTSNESCNPSLQTASAQPAKEVIVKGVPASFTELVAGFKVDGFQGFIPTTVKRLDNSDVAVVAPLHPTKGKAGGDVQLTISSGGTSCPALSLRIEPLTRVPGTTKKLVASIQTYIDQTIKNVGSSHAQLIGNPSSLPEELVPLAVMQWLLDHPNNPNSLRAILNGTSPVLEGQLIDAEVLDGLMFNSGVNDSLDRLLKENLVQSQTPINSKGVYKVASVVRFPADSGYLAPYVSDSSNTLALLPQRTVWEDLVICKSITTAEKLDSCMKEHEKYKDFFSGEYFRSVEAAYSRIAISAAIATIVSIGATALTGGGAAPGVAFFAGIGGAATILGFIMFIQQDFAESFLPSVLEPKLTFELTKTEFSSPDDKAPGFWNNVKLKARNKDWALTYKKAQQFLDLFVSLAGGTALGEFKDAVGSLFQQYVLPKLVVENKALFPPVKGKDFVVDATGKPVSQGSNVYNGSEFIEGSASPDGVIIVFSGLNRYEPFGSGKADLTLKTTEGSFASQQAQGDPRRISVGKKDDDGGGGSSWAKPQQTVQQQVKNCRVGPVQDPKWQQLLRDAGECIVPGAVMALEGPVDGTTTCGFCSTIIGNTPPQAGSCNRIINPHPAVAFLGLNRPFPPCPPNWDSGW